MHSGNIRRVLGRVGTSAKARFQVDDSRPIQPLIDSMQGLQLTYDTLGRTRNEAAVDVLLAALADPDSSTRRSGLTALMARSESRAAEQVLAHWQLLRPDDLRLLRPRKRWVTPVIAAELKGEGEQVLRAISAAESIELTGVIPDLVLMAESSGVRQVRTAASDAVLKMVESLGQEARADRDQPTVRNPVLHRLADSVRRFSMHQNEKLVDAFLMTVSWGDADFRQLIGENSPQLELICKRLAESDSVSLNDLLAGFLRRRSIPEPITRIIQSRDCPGFRESILRVVGAEPTANVLRNLTDMGTPVCCLGGESLMEEVNSDYRAALAHVCSATDPDHLRRLHVVAAAVELGGPGCELAAASCFARCPVPAIEIWMRAAIPIAGGDQQEIKKDANAHLLQRLIDLLDHADTTLVRSVRRILGPLHADQMLHRFDSLRPRTRRKLGRVVLMIDSDAIDRIRDALRHPVLDNRLSAIAAADALAIVDLLSDSFQHIVREDHQQARILAAEVMSDAEGETTLALLREMVELPESPVRDAAFAALSKRQPAVA